jgi:hypothetical protein
MCISLILEWKEQLELNKKDVSNKEAFFKYIHKEFIIEKQMDIYLVDQALKYLQIEESLVAFDQEYH